MARSLVLQELRKKQPPKRSTRASKRLEEHQLKVKDCEEKEYPNRKPPWFFMPKLAFVILCSIAILRYCLVDTVCPDAVFASGGEATPQSDYMGYYAKTSTLGGRHNGGRPIYVNPNSNRYIFYWEATGKWFAGRNYNSDIVGLKSEDDAAVCPEASIRWDAMGWGADGEPSWEASTRISMDVAMECPDVVFVHGGDASISMLMGNYTRSSIPTVAINGGRPIYTNPHKQHMFFRSDVGKWFVGVDYDADIIGLRSTGATQCPHKAGVWEARSGPGTWKSGVSVVQEVFSLQNPAVRQN